MKTTQISKSVVYEFWYDYLKPKHGENGKPCHMDTDSFIVHVETDDIDKDIAEDVEKEFEIPNYETDRLLPKGKNEKVVGLIKDELGVQIMREFVELRAKNIQLFKREQ